MRFSYCGRSTLSIFNELPFNALICACIDKSIDDFEELRDEFFPYSLLSATRRSSSSKNRPINISGLRLDAFHILCGILHLPACRSARVAP